MLDEVVRVRAEMGYPILVTPVSQLVAFQATRNVIDPERWLNVSDETVRYFLGHYGEFAAPPDPDVADRVLSLPKVEALRDAQPVSLEGARARFGDRISDEELLLRLTMPQEQVDAMRAAPPIAERPARAPHHRRRPARPPPARGRAAARRSRTSASARATTWWCGAVRLDDVRGFVFDIDGTLVHRAGAEVHVIPGAREVLETDRGVRDGRTRSSRTAATWRPPRSRASCARRGLPVDDEQVLTPLCSVQTYLDRFRGRRARPAVR